ncbi:MAG: hypothetical protein N3I35_05520 [Clostridia bacterium]|nr:hypothetical protein [Clostridia bacterium]
MLKKNIVAVIAVLFIGVSIIINGYFIAGAKKPDKLQNPVVNSADRKVLNVSQAAEYMNITEEEIQGIIKTEDSMLKKSGSFVGKMFPYFTINNKKYFYKNEIDEWLTEVSRNRREYNTVEGWLLQ